MSVAIDVDLRDQLAAARDQRSRPTCLVFAASAAHEASRSVAEYLSIEFLFYSGAQRSHKDPRRGLTLKATAAALQHDGQPRETAWPYLAGTPHAASWKPPAISEAAHKASLDFSVRTLSEVRDVLRAGAPVLLVLELSVAMYTPDEHGIVRARANDKITTRRHALLAVGSGHARDGSYILVRNSWGESWGHLGHAWLHDRYLAPRLQTTGVISAR